MTPLEILALTWFGALLVGFGRHAALSRGRIRGPRPSESTSKAAPQPRAARPRPRGRDPRAFPVAPGPQVARGES